MWWETLPSLVIVSAALTAPPIFFYFTNKLILGTPYRRRIERYYDAHFFLRDMRISGVDNPYVQLNLNDFDCEKYEKPSKE